MNELTTQEIQERHDECVANTPTGAIKTRAHKDRGILLKRLEAAEFKLKCSRSEVLQELGIVQILNDKLKAAEQLHKADVKINIGVAKRIVKAERKLKDIAVFVEKLLNSSGDIGSVKTARVIARELQAIIEDK